jgi:hypothetical protein
MDILDYAQQLEKHAQELTRLSKLYAIERKKFGELEADLLLILASKVNIYKEVKKNLGIDMAFEMLMADEEVNQSHSTIKEDFRSMKKAFHNYKALERLINAQESNIMAIQSIMKYSAKEDTFGRGGL